MRLVTFTFATETQAEICATNTSVASGASLVLNGGNTNYGSINSAGYIPRAVIPGVQRTVRVFSTGDISTSTFQISGLDVNGYSISTTFAGATGTAGIAQSTSEFSVITGVSNVTTAATTPLTVGWGASGSTNAVVIDRFMAPCITSVAVVVGATSGPVTVQHTFDNVLTATAPTWSTATGFSGVTSATNGTFTENACAFRGLLVATAAATSAIQINFVQAGY